MDDEQQSGGSVRRPSGYEWRGRGVGRLELRQRRDTNDDEGDGGDPVLFGSIPYNTFSVPLGYFESFREKIAAGCFDTTVGEDNIVALFNHADDNLLGRSNPDVAEAGRSLRFLPTDDAMTYEVDLDNGVELDRMVANRVERGILEGNSFGFETVRAEWDYSDEDNVERTLIEARLFDVGPVTFPAYPDSENELRSFIPGGVEQKIRGMLTARKAHRRALARVRLREIAARG